jgi:hypothetical protein
MSYIYENKIRHFQFNENLKEVLDEVFKKRRAAEAVFRPQKKKGCFCSLFPRPHQARANKLIIFALNRKDWLSYSELGLV